MGFLRFLTKGKEKKIDDLDVPPVPPASMDFGDLDDALSAPFPGDEMISPQSYPSAPPMGTGNNFPSFEDHMMDNAPPQEQKIPSFLSKGPAPQPERVQVAHHPHVKGPTFVEVAHFHHMIEDVQDIRGDLRKAGLVLTEMLHTIADREKDYIKYRNSLMDIQKKLVFVDKTLFSKGERQ